MFTPQAWANLIFKRVHGPLNRLHVRLFQDVNETAAYLNGLNLIISKQYPSAATLAAMQESEVIERIKPELDFVRERFRGFDLERSTETLLALEDKCHGGALAYILFGTRHGESDMAVAGFTRLLDIFDRNFLQQTTRTACALNIMISLLDACGRKHTATWNSVVRRMYDNRDTTLLARLVFAFGHMSEQIEAVPQSAWCLVVGPFANYHCRLPVPDELWPWFQVALTTELVKYERVNRRLENVIQIFQANLLTIDTQYQDMWLDMMIAPRYGLRPDGLDSVTLDIPILCDYRYTDLTLLPETEFPRFRAQYRMEMPWGNSLRLELLLEPSSLRLINLGKLPEDDPRVWIDRLLAFVAVRTMWRIVMGVRPTGQSTGGNGGGGGNADIRPHFRTLPVGQNMSDEARLRALDTFRTTPLPGFTFVRYYKRGDPSQSGAPLFAADQSDLPPGI